MQHWISGHIVQVFGAGCLFAACAAPAQAGGSVTYVRYTSSGCGPSVPVSYGYSGGYAYVGGYAPYVACPPVVAPAPVYRTYATPYVRCAPPVVARTYTYAAPSYRSYGYRSYGYSRGCDDGRSSGYRSGYVGRGSVGHYGGYAYHGAGYRSGSSSRGWSVGVGGSRGGSSAGVSFRYYKR